MGQNAAAHLLRLIREGGAKPQQRSILVSPTFVKRHSTAKVSDEA
jgi:DNA-binding LacI/PurR family transcriptional regulator